MASAMGTGAAAVSLAASATGESEAEREALGTISLGSGLTELGVLALYLATSGPSARPLLEGRAGLLTLGGAATTASAIVLEAAASRLPVGGRLLRGLASLGTLAAGAILRFSVVHAGRPSATDRDETLRSTASSGPGSGWGGPRVG
jgi:hypothetical protein